MSDSLPTIRHAFVSTATVTPEQWDAAAATATSADGILAKLTTTPAWWDPAATAVTPYHRKAVVALSPGDSSDALVRRLRWGDYLIRGELGRGGTSAVFRGRCLRTNRDVALKRPRATSADPGRLRREAALLARLSHPAFLRPPKVETLDGTDVLVMESVRGESAARLVKRLSKHAQRVPWDAAVAWVLEVLAGLAQAHALGIVHRDITPRNLMISEAAVRLLDFGLAIAPDMPADPTPGRAVGTPDYMPPEQWASGAVGPPADVYALGGTLFFLLTGRPPFSSDTTHGLMLQHLTAEVPSLRPDCPDAPPALDAVLARMMAKNPHHRGTADDLCHQLSAILSETPPPAVPTTATDRRRPWLDAITHHLQRFLGFPPAPCPTAAV